MKNFVLGYIVGGLVCLGCATHAFVKSQERTEEKEMQLKADAYFAGQEEAAKACKGEMIYGE